MDKIIMFPHIGSYNHGCEAIVQSTIKLFPDRSFVLFSNAPDEDKEYISDNNISIKSDTKEIRRFSLLYLRALFNKYILMDHKAFKKGTFSNILKECRKHDLFFSIGGDLYCYDTPEHIYMVNRFVREKGCKSILWGCSVEPDLIDSRMKKDLLGYDLICARESISYEALKKINQNTIFTIDPAFTLPAIKTDLPSNKYIGINLSPLITSKEAVPNITFLNYKELICQILMNRKEDILLIPHVVRITNDDRSILGKLKQEFDSDKRVRIVENHSCEELKYIIGNSQMFIGARTHATIAAYSSCVPTLAVGYSIKAKGIAKDLFGTYENYVVPVQSLKTPFDLTNAFAWMAEREEEIRAHLQRIMPEYKSRINNAVEAVKQLERSI